MFHGHLRTIYVSALVFGLVMAVQTRLRADVPVACTVVYETGDGVFVSAGAKDGLLAGVFGWLQRQGKTLVRVEVMDVREASSFLRFLSSRSAEFPPSGTELTLVLERVAPAIESSEPTVSDAPSETLRVREGAEVDGADEPFVPLLGPKNLSYEAHTDAQNVFHGRLTVSQLFQSSPQGQFDATRTRVGTSGSLERIAKSPWALEWSGDVSYRGGDLFENVQDYLEPRFQLYRLALFRRFDDRSFVRLGRFLPRELPAVGYLDGAHAEKAVTESFRLGAMVGLKPNRNRLGFSAKEPTAVTYGTFGLGERGGSHYSATIGALASLYEGDLDRVAILTDQSFALGAWSTFASTEIDFDIGQRDQRDGTRVSRLDVSSEYRFAAPFTLRAGVDRFEIPDTEAEREALDVGFLEEIEFLDRGFWRYWAGARHELPLQLTLSEEVTVTDAVEDDWRVRWSASLSRRGLPFLPNGSLTLTGYNLRGDDVKGYGGRVSAHLPFLKGRLSFQPAVAYRRVEWLITEDDLYVFDYSLRTNWVISRSWVLAGGLSYATTSELDRALIDVALTYKW